MPSSEYKKESEYFLPEDTMLPVTLTAVDVKEFDSKDSNRNQEFNADGTKKTYFRWEWTFTVTSGEYKGAKAKVLTQDFISSHENNKVRQFAETLLNVPKWEEGRGIDTDELIGLPAVVTIKHQPPKPRRDGNGMFYGYSVEDVFPASALAEPAF